MPGIAPEKPSSVAPTPFGNPGLEIRPGFIYENLTHGYQPWTEEYIDAVQRLADRTAIYGTFRETERFGLSDQEIMLGGYVPLDKNWTMNPSASWSPSHNILAKYSASSNFNRKLGAGWGIEVGYEYRAYNPTDVNLERLTVEKYFGDFRVAYTLGLAQGSNTGDTSAHTLSFGYYYNEHSSLNAAASLGSELESVATNDVRLFNVRSANVWGSHWFDQNWAISYGLGIESFQPAYTKRKVELGFRYHF
jgi:YaiO family outer membrane protein